MVCPYLVDQVVFDVVVAVWLLLGWTGSEYACYAVRRDEFVQMTCQDELLTDFAQKRYVLGRVWCG